MNQINIDGQSNLGAMLTYSQIDSWVQDQEVLIAKVLRHESSIEQLTKTVQLYICQKLHSFDSLYYAKIQVDSEWNKFIKMTEINDSTTVCLIVPFAISAVPNHASMLMECNLKIKELRVFNTAMKRVLI